MNWQFSNSAPIYTQLIGQIRAGIVSGALAPGERLPSVRDLAMEAGVNPNTMQRALTELERDGLVYSQRTSGRYVTEDRDVISAARHALAAGKVRTFLSDMTAPCLFWNASSSQRATAKHRRWKTSALPLSRAGSWDF